MRAAGVMIEVPEVAVDAAFAMGLMVKLAMPIANAASSTRSRSGRSWAEACCWWGHRGWRRSSWEWP